jgi:pyruvate/oxaloacetate carboxyltransferase
VEFYIAETKTWQALQKFLAKIPETQRSQGFQPSLVKTQQVYYYQFVTVSRGY